MATLKDEITIGGMKLRNRLALPPLTTNYGSPEGKVTDAILRFYEERSRDVGLVIVEATAVQEDGRILKGSLGLWEDAQAEGMARLAKTVKGAGAAAVLQLNHAGARCHPVGGPLQGASPSGVTFNPAVPAFALNEEQIRQLVAHYARASVRAMEAGFDGVEIHGAHLYLISQFLSPLTNRREDRYGGDALGRATFAREVVKAVRDRLGPGAPIFFRLNAVEGVEGGQTEQDALTVAKAMAGAGVDVLDVSLVPQVTFQEVEGGKLMVASSAFPKDAPPAGNMDRTAEIRRAAGLPVIGVGKMGVGSAAAEAVDKWPVDIIAIGRQMIADPDSAGKILDGKTNEVIACEECMSCFGSIRAGKPMKCKVNKELPGGGLEPIRT